jgi:signal transduction histidine kinase
MPAAAMIDADPRQRQVRQFVFVLGCAGVLAVASLVLSVMTWARLRSNIAATREASGTLMDWNLVMGLVQDIEIGQRGYLLTGDDTFLKPHAEAEKKLPAHWEALGKREMPGSGFEGRVAAARQLADQVLKHAQETIVLRRHGNEQAARELVQAGEGRAVMERFRETMAAESRALSAAITAATGRTESDLQAGLATAVTTGIVSLATAGIALLLLRRIVREMRRAERYAAERRRAEEAQQEKSSYLAMMSHEIRTPLNAILGFGELVQAEAKSPITRRYADSIVAGGRALLQLLNDVLDLSKLDAGMMELKPGPVNVPGLVEFCERLFRENAAKKGVALESRIAPEVPASLLLDEIRLRQVLINLIGNAVKFTERGRVLIAVSGGPHADDASRWGLVFEVEDTGPGIAEADRARIFKPFVQSESDARSTSSGTGLGLSIVQRFASLMGGSVEVESVVGKGSIFRLRLPDVAISTRLAAAAAAEPQQEVDFNALAPARIVVADDNETNIELLRELFRGTHHEIFVAKNGREAIGLIADVEPHLVLMDIRMPEMDGVEAVKTLRSDSRFKLLPVIAVTASSRIEDLDPSQAGFDAGVRKPFARADLFAQMAQFLPPAPEPEPREESAVGAPSPTWKQLAAQWRTLETERWPALRDGMALSEVQAFARDLRAMAEAAACPPAVRYAAEIEAAASAFSFAEIEQLILAFPRQIERLESATSDIA